MANEKQQILTRWIQGAIRDAVAKALVAKPVKVHLENESRENCFFEIDGEIYSENSAIQKILGEYSWYNY